MDSVKQLIRQLIPQNHPQIQKQIALENIHNLYIVSLYMAAFECIALLSYSMARGIQRQVIAQVSFCILSCIVINLLARAMKKQYREAGILVVWKVNAAIVLFYGIMTAWSLAVDGFHYAQHHQMLTFYVVQFCFVVFLLLPGAAGALVYAAGFVAFYLMLYHIDGARDIQLPNLCAFLFVVIVAGYVRLAVKYRQISENGDRQQVYEEINQIKNYEKLVNEAMKISLAAEKPEDNLNTMLRYLGEMFDGDRAYIFEKNEKNEDDNTFEWCAEGIEPQIQNLQNVPPIVTKSWYDVFAKKKSIVITNMKAIKKSDPLVYKTLEPQKVDTLITFALYENKSVIGFFGIDNPSLEGSLVTEDILEIISNFLVSLLRKRNLVRQLQRLSYTDAVTGAENRFAMYDYFEALKHSEHLGVVFGDITGLKEVNDTEGHGAGDALIRNSYQCLIRQFRAQEVFRIGGDEFVVLCRNISEEELQGRIKNLREDLQAHKIVMAVGAEYLPVAKDTIEATIEGAEAKMYQEKAAWYEQEGKDRRRSNK